MKELKSLIIFCIREPEWNTGTEYKDYCLWRKKCHKIADKLKIQRLIYHIQGDQSSS